MIREAVEADLQGLLPLYAQLHGDVYQESSAVEEIWRQIFSDARHHIIVAEEAGNIISSCVLVIVPNLTHGLRPYALIENVVTNEKHRGRGLATGCLNYAKEIAVRENCYKIMLMTGSKKESTLRFYERAGYNRSDKTAFVQWIP